VPNIHSAPPAIRKRVAVFAVRRAQFDELLPRRGPRYDKREGIYLATIDVASMRIWLRDPVT